jgi:hypothetical protein
MEHYVNIPQDHSSNHIARQRKVYLPESLTWFLASFSYRCDESTTECTTEASRPMCTRLHDDAGKIKKLSQILISTLASDLKFSFSQKKRSILLVISSPWFLGLAFKAHDLHAHTTSLSDRFFDGFWSRLLRGRRICIKKWSKLTIRSEEKFSITSFSLLTGYAMPKSLGTCLVFASLYPRARMIPLH